MKTKRDTSKEVSKLIYKEIINDISGFERVLEPSAGEGNLLDYLNSKMIFENPIDVIELNSDKVKILQEKGYNVISRDYLSTKLENKYDVIIACPPFKDDTNLEHIQKMYQDLKYMGKVVTLCNTKWIYDNSDKAIKFRKFLEDKKYHIKMLPDNSFIEKHKTVPTMIISITKYE